jgi:hypothetical protein
MPASPMIQAKRVEGGPEMGISDKLGDMADEAKEKMDGADRMGDQIGKGAEAANKATGGKYEEQIHRAEDGAKTAADKLAKKKNKRK